MVQFKARFVANFFIIFIKIDEEIEDSCMPWEVAEKVKVFTLDDQEKSTNWCNEISQNGRKNLQKLLIKYIELQR